MPDVSVTPLGHDLYLIDAFMHGAPENLACYLFDTPQRVLIECGPSRTIDHLFAALDHLGIDDAGTLAVTHIPLDHAGGAGHFAARFPKARVAVHRLGAPPPLDPARPGASAPPSSTRKRRAARAWSGTRWGSASRTATRSSPTLRPPISTHS